MDEIKNLLEKDYNLYCNKVSTEIMASSLECVLLLLGLCMDAKSVIDFGSGFSSYALRKFAKIYNKDIEIYSVDDDVEWLDKTRQFIEQNGLDSKNILPLDAALKLIDRKFNVVFFDIAHYQDGTRQAIFPAVLNRFVENETKLLVDDLHIFDYFIFIYNYLTERCKYKMINTRPQTLDKFGRFSMLFTDIKHIKQ